MATAGLMRNKTLLEKADLELSNLQNEAGYLQEAQAKKFVRSLIKQSVFMQQCTAVPMKSHKMVIDKIKFGSRVLRPGAEYTALPVGDRAKPDLAKIELDAKLFKAECRLSNEVLEDSIEGGRLKQTIMDLLTEAISRDMEEVVLLGDTTSTVPTLAVLDGVVKQVNTNQVDAGVTWTNKSIFRDMLRTMPSEYLRDKTKMRYYTSVDSAIHYEDTLGNRQTNVGDQALINGTGLKYSGVPIESVPLFPEDLGTGTNETIMLLLDPKNVNIGVWRSIMIETDKLISEGTILIVVTMRFDVRLTEELATVKAHSVRVS
jgi:HK97 family phage major capsid protein